MYENINDPQITRNIVSINYDMEELKIYPFTMKVNLNYKKKQEPVFNTLSALNVIVWGLIISMVIALGIVLGMTLWHYFAK